MSLFLGMGVGIFLYFIFTCWYTVQPDERAVKTVFGKAQRLSDKVNTDLTGEEAERYQYPQAVVIQPGLHFKMPWEKIHKVSASTQVIDMAYDPENPRVNNNNTALDAITKDQLDIDLKGQIRLRVSEKNIYAFIFGVKNPMCYVTGYFSALLREKVANFEQPAIEQALSDNDADTLHGAGAVSINDLRRNLRSLNEAMEQDCKKAEDRYGVILEASLVTEIIPPIEIEGALAAINTAHNVVSADISLAQAQADQRIVESGRAIEITTLKAQGETENLIKLTEELTALKAKGPDALQAYVKNIRLAELDQARVIYKRNKEVS
jgi:regulator of protease activity HflC (stomatin/prohibitin superfamily)